MGILSTFEGKDDFFQQFASDFLTDDVLRAFNWSRMSHISMDVNVIWGLRRLQWIMNGASRLLVSVIILLSA